MKSGKAAGPPLNPLQLRTPQIIIVDTQPLSSQTFASSAVLVGQKEAAKKTNNNNKQQT
jgi:hypothetical protein